jgi:hypothetical protein
MDQVASALVVAVIIGLTTAAYKHPVPYQKGIVKIEGFFFLVLVGMAVWDISNIISYRHVSPVIIKAAGLSRELEIAKIVESIKVPAVFYAGMIGVMGYTYFLLWLPDILKENRRRRKKRNKE